MAESNQWAALSASGYNAETTATDSFAKPCIRAGARNNPLVTSQSNSLGHWLREGGLLLRRHFWAVIGAVAAGMLIGHYLNKLGLPGKVIRFLLSGPVWVLPWWICINRLRGERTPAEMWGDYLGALPKLVPTGIVVMLPALAWGFLVGFLRATLKSAGESMQVVVYVLGGVVGLVAVYLLIVWMFALPLVADKQCGIGEALRVSLMTVHENFGRVLGLIAVVVGIIGLVFLLFLHGSPELKGLSRWVGVAVIAAFMFGIYASLGYAFAAAASAYESLLGQYQDPWRRTSA